MNSMLSNGVLLLQLVAAGTALLQYVESFLGCGWDEGGRFVVAAFVCGFLASIPTAIRDRMFFKRYWGFGFRGMRNRFPFQMFPARQDRWLNPAAWGFMAVLLLHFIWLVISSVSTEPGIVDTHADLRYTSLMVTVGNVIGALAWEYPPTEKPKDLGIEVIP